MLTLAEELFLLTLNEKKNSIAVSSAKALPAAMVSAMLIDFFLEGRIQMVDNDKVSLVDGDSSESDYFNHLLEKIGKAKKPKKLSHWIEAFSSKPKKLEKSLVKSLIEKKVLKEKKKKLLWVTPFIDYSQADASAKFSRKRHLRAVILAGEKADLRSAILLSLLRAYELMNFIFTDDEISYARNRIEAIIRDPSLDATVHEITDKVSIASAKVIKPAD